MGSERRSSPRINVHIPVFLRSSERLGHRECVGGEIINLSSQGICIVGPVLPNLQAPAGTLLLTIKRRKGQLDLAAKLVWTQRETKTTRLWYGLSCLDKPSLSILRKMLSTQEDFLRTLAPHNRESDDTDLEKVDDVVDTFFTRDVRQYLEKLFWVESKLDREKGLKHRLFRSVERLSDGIVKRGDHLQCLVNDKPFAKAIKACFRKVAGEWVYQSEIMERGFKKPRGYPGDYYMLELIYENRVRSPGIGAYFDQYFLNNAYAAAVRNRKDMMHEMLSRLLEEKRGPVRILNLACGSCREIRELLPSLTPLGGRVITFTCLDNDGEALEFAESKIRQIAPDKVKFRFVREDTLSFLRLPVRCNPLGTHDVIYSIGLIDYLPDRILKSFLRFSYGLLEKGGVLILTHKDKERYRPLPADWFCDWSFVSRSEQKVIQLVREAIGGKEILIEREQTGCIFFLTIRS